MQKKQCSFGLLTVLALLACSSVQAKESQFFQLSGTTVRTTTAENRGSYFVNDSKNFGKTAFEENILPETRILIFYENDLIAKTVSNQQGKFQLKGLRSGDYLIFAKNDQTDSSAVASFSLTSENSPNENLQLILTNDSSLDEFFQQKWNNGQITRSQMPLYNDNDEMPEDMVQPQMMPNEHPYSHLHQHHIGFDQYDNRRFAVATGGHCWGTWLAAGALSAAIVALAVEDDTEPVSPTK